MGGCIVAVWLRNRDILRDLFDYSTVITAAGKVEVGLRPYTEIRSPMQSSVYLLNFWTEQIFGRNYLALTLGGLIQALGGGLLIRWMLCGHVREAIATGTALAVTLAGLSQHVVFFYNPIGILCFSIVLLGLAVEPELWPVQSGRTWAILGALVLGGINKLNFQGATLVLAGLLTLAAWANNIITKGAVVRNLLLLTTWGIAIPLGLELAWTGASPGLWWDNVVALPEARYLHWERIFKPEIYLRPVHDFHHHILLRPIGGIGLVLLLATGVWLLRAVRINRRPVADGIARSALVVVGGGLCALLMTTNHETVMLTSVSYLVLSVALLVRYEKAGRLGGRWPNAIVTGMCLVWSVAGGYAAWHGSRVLYAPDPPPRSSYERLVSPPRALAYFDGVRMLPEQIDALRRVAARLQEFENSAGQIDGILFGPALEWLERAYPEAMVSQAPIWYHAGTSLRDGDEAYFRGLLVGEKRLLTHKFWQAWPGGILQLLEHEYRTEPIGSRDLLYHPRGPAPPAVAPRATAGAVPAHVFRNETASNVLLSATRHSDGMHLKPGAAGMAFGGHQSTNWNWPLGARDFQGVAVARFEGRAAGRLTFRIIAGDPDRGDVLWEKPLDLSKTDPETAIPFRLNAGGRPLWLQTSTTGDPQSAVFAGWRQLRITYAAELDHTPALPYNGNLRPVEGWPENLRESRWYARGPQARLVDGTMRLPAENWRLHERPEPKVRVRVAFTPNPRNPADPVVVTLAWYRAGRFEIMARETIDLRFRREATLVGYVPESVGWVGLLTRPAGEEGVGHGVRIISWDVE